MVRRRDPRLRWGANFVLFFCLYARLFCDLLSLLDELVWLGVALRGLPPADALRLMAPELALVGWDLLTMLPLALAARCYFQRNMDESARIVHNIIQGHYIKAQGA